METDDSKVEIIQIKVRNTINLDKINRNVLGWIERKSEEDPSFRGHYYTPYELTQDIGLVEDLNKREALVEWLRKQKTIDPIIRKALEYLEKEK